MATLSWTAPVLLLQRAAGEVAGAARAGVSTARLLGETARTAAETVRLARDTVQAAHRVTLRADVVLQELEGPLLALAPGLTRLARVLDDPVVDAVPEAVRRLQEDLLPALRTLAGAHERVASVAGSTERLMSFVDDTGRSLAGLPVAGLLGRRRPAPPVVVTVEQVEPGA